MAKRRFGKIARRRPRRKPKVRFYLFCEGRNTEPAYFSAIKKIWTGALVSIKCDPGIGVPITVAEKAVEFAKKEGLAPRSRRRKNSFEKRDRVWAVFDRDDHDRFDGAVRLCEDNGVAVARSNPCFEVWLILHEQDFNRPDDRHQVQRELQRLRPEYGRLGAKVPDCEELVVRVKDAEERGEALCRLREDEMDPHGRPSTTVGELTNAIREANKRM